MKKINDKLAIAFICALLGIILSIQFNTVDKVVGKGSLPTTKSKELISQIKSLNEEKEKLASKLNEIESEILKEEKKVSEKNRYVNILSNEILKYKIYAGYEKAHGPGIIFKLDDPKMEETYGQDISFLVANYDYLLEIVSTLNGAGAEGISINGIRYTPFAEVLKEGNNIKFNDYSINPPFEIKAVGDPEELKAQLINIGLIQELMYKEYEVHISKEEDVLLPKYNEIKEFKYAKPVDSIFN
ncbi:MAG: DUF881 domain-containing protein [Firmicutes bacterium]|nr:DUF881 domain-containing protein [Bacillota bacterium]